MNDLNSLCLTCLSSVEDGACISKPMYDFLCEVLHFKCQPQGDSLNHICRKCYGTLIVVKRFCMQLRDVETYFECKSKTEQTNDEVGLVDEVEEIDSVEEAELSNQDPISIETEPQLEAVNKMVDSNEVSPPLAKPNGQLSKNKFVCLICSKLFSSIRDLRSHENIHLAQINRNSLPVILNTMPQKQKRHGCPDCGNRFDLMRELTAHRKEHVLDKLKPFRCCRCSRRFLTSQALRDHELVHMELHTVQCQICPKKYLNQSSLEAHMRVSHNCCIDNASDIGTEQKS